MSWKFKTHEERFCGSIPLSIIKHQCPCCKIKQTFRRIDVISSKNTGYCEGYDIPFYRCDKCWIMIAIGEWVGRDLQDAQCETKEDKQ